jgi:hypothetical protein
MGPNAFNCSGLNEVAAIIAISPSPAASSGDDPCGGRDFRLLRIRIGLPLAEEHWPALLLTFSAWDPWLSEANTSLNRIAPLAAVSSSQTSNHLRLLLFGFFTEQPFVPQSVFSE